MHMKRFIKILAGILVSCAVVTVCQAQVTADRDTTRPPTVVLVSFDGFRWDYPEKTATPNLQRLAANGVRARGLIPVFPSKTFPNHYTLVTGLYAENHGIVANTMYDPERNAKFSLSNREAVADGRWWGGEPIWVTAAKQGQIAATFFWPGSEAEIMGSRPAHWKAYDDDVPNAERVRQVLAWLGLPAAQRPTFISLYFSDTDESGHRHGPDSPEVIEAIQQLDETLGMLLRGLEERGIFEAINLIVVSDHGMAPVSTSRVIFVDDYIDLKTVDVIDWSPVLALRPLGDEEAIHDALSHAHPHLHVYRREEIPVRFHYRRHRRIAPIIAMADEGWTIANHSFINKLKRAFAAGDHGYDNQLASMRGVFIAHGPAFRPGVVVAPFQNIHVYSLMTEILGLNPAPNDGSLDSVRVMLKTGRR